MSEIELRAEDLTKLLAKLNDEAAAVGTMKPEQRADAVAAVKERMEKAKREYKMVEMESRVLSGDAKTIWKNKLKEFQKQMNSIESELKWAGATSPDGKTGHKTSVADTEEGMSAYGRQLITETKSSADTAIQMLNDTENIGIGVATQLKQDTEKLQKMSDDLYAIEDNVKRATAITRRMFRRVATDRYMWVLIFLILVAIGFIIVWRVRNPGRKIDISDRLSNA